MKPEETQEPESWYTTVQWYVTLPVLVMRNVSNSYWNFVVLYSAIGFGLGRRLQ
ncbi:MAG: hypothetical protein WC052_03455 [Patescibacteria group bacterium]